MKNKILDFGERVDGARKFLSGKMTLEEMAMLSNAELKALAVKSKIWPWDKQKSKRLINAGEKAFVVYWKREKRKCCYGDARYNPETDNFRKRMAQYTKTIATVRDMVESVHTEADITKFYEKLDEYRIAEFTLCNEWKRDVRPTIGYQNHAWLLKKMADENFPEGVEQKSANKEKKQRFILPNIYNVKRTGPDWRYGRNIRDYSWQNEFSFRGVQFGNWVNQKERQKSLNEGYDALMDLSRALAVRPSDLSCDGKLSLAIGARGLSHAKAHYEPGRQIINLTKIAGAGSLAHEWMHFIDHMIAIWSGLNDGRLASEDLSNSALPKSFVKLVKALQYDLNGEKTGFMIGSEKFDNQFARDTHGYWSSKPEMLARAFACFVKDTLGYQSDYLVGHADAYEFEFDESENVCAIPQGDEREYFNELFIQMFGELRSLGYFHLPEAQPKLLHVKRITSDIIKYEEIIECQPNGQYVYAI